MRVAREALGLTQAELAAEVGGSKRGIQDNETRNTVPGGQVLAGFVRLGINANWMLTGEGPMRLEELQRQAQELVEERARADALQAKLDQVEARLREASPVGVPLNEAAMRGMIIGVIEAHKCREVSADYIATRAVDLYRQALDEQIITPTGVGEGGEKAA